MKTLREYRVTLTKCDPGEHAVDLDAVGTQGQRTKLGGEPDWEQGDDRPNCPSCFTAMSFVGQIDSVEHWSKTNPHSHNPLKKEQDFMFGDVGLIYVFFCFDCLQSQAVFQCG